MKRRRIDLRIWLPTAIATGLFALRALPAPAVPPTERPRSISLPQVYGAANKTSLQRFELDAERSSVRLLVTGARGRLLAQCDRIEGELQLGPGSETGALQLRLDLASLRALTPPANGLLVRHVVGVLGESEVDYRGRLVAMTTTDLPGVSTGTWLGTIHFGSRVQQQGMQLWRCSLPGRPLRLQGHGTMSGAEFSLQNRWFGLFDEPYEVTLGLDLAWRRVRDR